MPNRNVEPTATRVARLRRRPLFVTPKAIPEPPAAGTPIEIDGSKTKFWLYPLTIKYHRRVADRTQPPQPVWVDMAKLASDEWYAQEIADRMTLPAPIDEQALAVKKATRAAKVIRRRVIDAKPEVLVHELTCKRYGPDGDPQTKHCHCVRHIPRKQANEFVDRAFVRWLTVERNGRQYRTRHSVVQVQEFFGFTKPDIFVFTGGYDSAALDRMAGHHNGDSEIYKLLVQDVVAAVAKRMPNQLGKIYWDAVRGPHMYHKKARAKLKAGPDSDQSCVEAHNADEVAKAFQYHSRGDFKPTDDTRTAPAGFDSHAAVNHENDLESARQSGEKFEPIYEEPQRKLKEDRLTMDDEAAHLEDTP